MALKDTCENVPEKSSLAATQLRAVQLPLKTINLVSGLCAAAEVKTVTVLSCVAIYLYHKPFVPGSPKEQADAGGVPVIFGAVVVPGTNAMAVAHVNCAKPHVIFNNKTKRDNIFFMVINLVVINFLRTVLI